MVSGTRRLDFPPRRDARPLPFGFDNRVVGPDGGPRGPGIGSWGEPVSEYGGASARRRERSLRDLAPRRRRASERLGGAILLPLPTSASEEAA
jgi:hypothetical protein